MRLPRLLRSLFPRPRVPLTLRHALPLVLFLIAYAGACIALELTDTLLFGRPAMFGLMVLSVWIWWMHLGGYSGLGRARGLTALLVRLALLGLLVMLLAEPRAVRTQDVLSVVYAVDISDSIGEQATDEALRFVVRTVTEKPPTDEAGVIVFGRNAAVELPPRKTFPLEAGNVINSLIDRDATNLEQALSLGAAMLPEENRGRIVLISDGTQTDGTMSQVLDELKSRGVAVDVLPIQYNYQHEVWLERLELPQMVKIGENYEASIVLSSLQSGRGDLILKENGQTIAEQSVEFQPGKNRYTIPIYLREPGYYEYTATIQVPRDRDNLQENNTVLNYLFVEGEGRVLVVTDPAAQADSRDYEPLVKALKEAERVVDVKTAYEFPRDALSMMPYDCIVFVNVAADAFDAVQLGALKDAVRDLGIGFLMVGGPNSFGPGGYHRTAVEEILPVTMDITKKKVLPKGALVIILHTCEFPEGNTWAKRITKQAIKVLGAQDEVGVIIYNPAGMDQWVFELTPAEKYDEMVTKINAAEPADMGSFAGTMQMGLNGLKKSDAATKHMIIISDGDPQPPPPELVSSYIANKVSVSMVAIFPHGGNDISTMRAIAGATGGRYYFPADPSLLPSIFIKESKTLKRSMIQNKTITPEAHFPSQILKGLTALPPLKGYVLTSIKEEANPVETILAVPSEEEGDESGDIDPVLAVWRFGLGRTAAFTSDLSPNWGAEWVEWDKYRAFVSQLLINISRAEKTGFLRMWTDTTGNEGLIVVEDFHPEEQFLEVQARVTGPRERTETVRLKQVGPRRYQATVPLWGKGRYQVMAVGAAGDREDRAIGGFIVPYSPEYLRFTANPIMLEQIAEKTGGQVLSKETTADDIYRTRRQPKQSSRPVFDWFLIALACLIPLDVALRRVQLDWSVIKSWFGLDRRRGPSTETMSTLLQRKHQVGTQLESRRAATPPPAARPATPTRRPPTAPTAAPPPPAAAPPPQQPPSSTTGRLLELKRKREQKD